MHSSKPTNYWEYIRVEELLDLQGGLEGDESQLVNDEVMFIVVHQVYELWFKLVRRELIAARDLFKAEHVEEQELAAAARSVKRVTTILRRCVDHFEVMETLTTRDYLAFRDKLMPASGFQSAQLRQIEILLGLEEEDRISLGLEESFLEALRDHEGGESPALARVKAQYADAPNLKTAMEEWLCRTPIDGVGPDEKGAGERLDEFLGRYLAAHGKEADNSCELAMRRTRSDADRDRLRERYDAEKAAVRGFLNPSKAEGGARTQRLRAAALFITTYRELPLLAWPREILDGLIELEQVFVVFRQRHARMVERVIGRRTGTGGSAGVDYLDQTALQYRIFKDLWAVRTIQIQASAIPPLENPAFYDFRNG